MTGLIGEFESTLDAKNRFLLPVQVKRQLPPDQANFFVINKGFEGCLSLYPLKTWEPLIERISKLSDFDPKAREFRRFFLNGATPVEPDSAGRILLSANLKEHAGLEKDIVLVGVGEKFEIWDSNKYKKLFESLSEETFSNLAKEIMDKTENRGDNQK